mgnify:CR=1 FL=1
MKYFTAVLISPLLVGCSSFKERAEIPASHFGPSANTEASCIAAGGEWEGSEQVIVGQRCSVPTPDAGKPCSDHSDCSGLCVALDNPKPGSRTQGTCYHSYNIAGPCLTRVSKGRAEWPLCVD